LQSVESLFEKIVMRRTETAPTDRKEEADRVDPKLDQRANLITDCSAESVDY
jgi:hypothetical protein